MILFLGASSYIGRKAFSHLGGQRCIGTHNSRAVPGSVFFDATKMRVAEVLPADTDVTHAVICYAEAGIDACKADIERSRMINVLSPKQVIDDLVSLGIKPVFLSSEMVFDGSDCNYTETDQPEPNTVYGAQKLEIEHYLAERCPDHAVLRLAKVYGTEPGDGTVLTGWLKPIFAQEEIPCARDQVFSPIHVDDVAAVIDAAVSLDLSGTYHTSGPEAWSRLGMLQALVASLGVSANIKECSIRDFDFLDNRPLDVSMDSVKTLAATGLKLRTVQDSCQEISQASRAPVDAN